MRRGHREEGIALVFVLLVGTVLSVIAAEVVFSTSVAAVLSTRRIADLQSESARWSGIKIAQATICEAKGFRATLDFEVGGASVFCRIEDESQKIHWKELVALPRYQRHLAKLVPQLSHLVLPQGSLPARLPEELLPPAVPLEAIYGSRSGADSFLRHVTFWGDGKVNWRAPAAVLSAKLSPLGPDRIEELIGERDAGKPLTDIPLNQRERELLRDGICEDGSWYSVYLEVRLDGFVTKSFHILSMEPGEPSVVFSQELTDV